jgi:hypothetical protein
VKLNAIPNKLSYWLYAVPESSSGAVKAWNSSVEGDDVESSVQEYTDSKVCACVHVNIYLHVKLNAIPNML